MCLSAAITGIFLAGYDNNIFTQIGLVVLIGLAAKNAILIVEFAKQKQEQEHLARNEAVLEAARLRLRPILMTAFAFILGVVPLVTGKGAGAEMRNALGLAVFSGMLGVTIFGVFYTPIFYSLVMWVTGDPLLKKPAADKAHQPAADGKPEPAATETAPAVASAPAKESGGNGQDEKGDGEIPAEQQKPG